MSVDAFTFLRSQGYEGTTAQMVARYNLDAKKGNVPLILDGQTTTADVSGALGTTFTGTTFVGAVTGAVTGNTGGTHTGAVVGNVTGDLTGKVLGEATTQSVVLGKGVLADAATDGFVYVPTTTTGTPTGAPTAKTGYCPLVMDVAAGKLWAYYAAAWHYAALT